MSYVYFRLWVIYRYNQSMCEHTLIIYVNSLFVTMCSRYDWIKSLCVNTCNNIQILISLFVIKYKVFCMHR